nr:SemiSWEET transporter [Teredinibacter haidensis]
MLGYIAACFTTFSFLPQAIKVIRTRDTKALSLWMYAVFTIGILLWLAYGVVRNDSAIIVANIVTFFLSFIILFIKASNVYRAVDSVAAEPD